MYGHFEARANYDAPRIHLALRFVSKGTSNDLTRASKDLKRMSNDL